MATYNKFSSHITSACPIFDQMHKQGPTLSLSCRLTLKLKINKGYVPYASLALKGRQVLFCYVWLLRHAGWVVCLHECSSENLQLVALFKPQSRYVLRAASSFSQPYSRPTSLISSCESALVCVHPFVLSVPRTLRSELDLTASQIAHFAAVLLFFF